MSLKELIETIPSLINYFLPGYVFFIIYYWLNNQKINTTILTINSLFLSTLIQAIFSLLHIFILSSIKFNNFVKILIYAITATMLSIIFTKFRNSNLFETFLYKINYKNKYDDLFNNIIDFEKKTMVKIYIKGRDFYYLGQFSTKEEHGLDSWISLIKYSCISADNKTIIFNSEDVYLSSIAIKFRDIERIELIYEDDSKVWKHLTNVGLPKETIQTTKHK